MNKRWRILGSVALLAVGLYLATQAVSALRWRLLAGVHGFGGSTARYVAYYFIGMFFNLVLPTSVGGDVVRAWYLDERSGACGIAVDVASGNQNASCSAVNTFDARACASAVAPGRAPGLRNRISR